MIAYRGETERVDLYSECRNVLLLKLASNVTLDEGGLEMAVNTHDAKLKLGIAGYLASTTITNKNKLEGWDARCCFCHGRVCDVGSVDVVCFAAFRHLLARVS